MKKLFLFATSALMMLGSCSQDEMVNVPLMAEEGKDVIVASIEGQPSTRMTEDNGVLSWEDYETFVVFGDRNETFTISDKTTGTFSGTQPANAKYAVYYPVGENSTIEDNVLTIKLASSYTSASSLKIPMWGFYEDGAILFKHLAAALKVSYNEIPVGYTTLLVEASKPINGNFTATLTDNLPILLFTDATVSDENKKVSVTITENQNGTFYVPLPVGTYDLKVYAQGIGKADIELKSWSNLTIERKGLYRTSATYVTIDDSTPAAVSSAIGSIQDNSIVDLTGIIDATADNAGNMILPDVDATYNFTETPTTSAEKPLTFVEADGGDGSNVNINMPTEATNLHAVINTPKSTVSIEGGTYESLEATTAENTLIIGEGVTIKKLVLKGGNVVLKGNVESIESEVATTITITLDKDITLNNSMTFSKGDVTVDLNGKSIKCASSDVFVVTDGTLTIDGEGLVYGSEADEGNSCAVWVNGANAKAIINNGTYQVGGDINGTTDKRNDCIYVGKAGGTIEIYGGVFEYTGKVKDGSINDGSRFLVNQNNKHATQLITVYGGTFHNFDPANAKTDEPWMTDGIGSFVAAGYSSVAGENGTYVVKKGIFNETALKGAIVNGAEITLYDDMTIAKAITIPTGITATINLNGFDVTAPNTDAFEVQGILTINGTNGTEESVVSAGTANPSGGVCAVWAHNGGKVTINGGYYKVYKDAEGKRNDCIYAGSNSKETAGSIVINGGKFEYASERNTSSVHYNGDLFLLNCANSQPTSKITVNAGSFKNHVPSKEPNGTENEVVLGEGKKVYNGGTEVTAAHSGTTDVWYEVR